MFSQCQLTTFMYAIPSFVEGVARLFDFAGTMTEYNTSLSPGDADRRALASDVMAILADAAMVTGSATIESKAKVA